MNIAFGRAVLFPVRKDAREKTDDLFVRGAE